MFQAAILDLDGLLIDSEPYWDRVVFERLAHLDVPAEALLPSETRGISVKEVVENYFKRYPWSGPDPQEVCIEIVSRVTDFIRREASIKPGVHELIQFFLARRIPMAICSSSPISIIEAGIDRLGIANVLTLYHSAQNEKRGKPAPDVYLTTCRKLAVEPRAAIAFEDSPNGVRAAIDAGICCVGVPDNGFPAEMIAHASCILNSLEEFDEERLVLLWNKQSR